jgi:hypothetical protein
MALLRGPGAAAWPAAGQPTAPVDLRQLRTGKGTTQCRRADAASPRWAHRSGLTWAPGRPLRKALTLAIRLAGGTGTTPPAPPCRYPPCSTGWPAGHCRTGAGSPTCRSCRQGPAGQPADAPSPNPRRIARHAGPLEGADNRACVAVRRAGPGQTQPVPAHHRPARRRLPPAAVGLHAGGLVRHPALRAAPRRRTDPRRPHHPPAPDDLVLRAARALQAATGTRHGRQIGVDKQMPAQAGMGGGSSDAATCLLALNRLWG